MIFCKFLYQYGKRTLKLLKDLFEKSLALGGAFAAKGLLKGTEKLLLLARKSGGGFDVDGENEVADTLWIVDVDNTLSAKGKGCSRLCSVGDVEFFGTAAEKGDVDRCAERCLYKRDGNFTEDIVALAGEEGMGSYLDLDDKITVRSAVSSRRALSAKDYALHIIDTRGDGYVKTLVDLDISLSVTIFTRGLYDLARTVTSGTGSLRLHCAKEGILLYGYVSATATGGTGLGLCTFCRAG